MHHKQFGRSPNRRKSCPYARKWRTRGDDSNRGGCCLSSSLWLERLFAFSKRDLKLKVSYRMSLILGLTSSISGLLVYGLLGNSASASITTQSYNMSLASYLVSGVAFSS